MSLNAFGFVHLKFVATVGRGNVAFLMSES